MCARTVQESIVGILRRCMESLIRILQRCMESTVYFAVEGWAGSCSLLLSVCKELLRVNPGACIGRVNLANEIKGLQGPLGNVGPSILNLRHVWVVLIVGDIRPGVWVNIASTHALSVIVEAMVA